MDVEQMEDLRNHYRLDKTHFSVVSLDDPPDDWKYWLSQPLEERLRFVEYLRQMNFGYERTSARLQRILEVAELPWS